MKVQHKFEEVEVHVNQILRAPEKKMRENGDNLRHSGERHPYNLCHTRGDQYKYKYKREDTYEYKYKYKI